MDSNIKNCPHFWQVDVAGGNNIYCSNCGLSKTLTALIIKTRADERQAMLDALPEKRLIELSDDIEPFKHGFNRAISEMETAIKKMGGE